MLKPMDPRELAVDLLTRSTCKVQVAAVLADHAGIFSWGWNSSWDGYGMHAEPHAITRANKRRLKGATIYVAARRKRNNKTVSAKPCDPCALWVRKWGLAVEYRNGDGVWCSITQD